MTYVFWLSVAWLSYVYVGYPAALWILGWVRRVRPRTEDGFLPTVSVLISARNEEKDIGWKIEETLKWDYPGDKLELLVASDASDDRTDNIVKGIVDTRLVFLRMEKRGGKGRALNALAGRARGEILFFTDANAHIAPDCLRHMVRHFADQRVGCVTGGTHPSQERSGAIEGGGSTYLDYEMLINRLENALGSVLVCDGAIFCLRRSLYAPVLPELANDLELPMRIGHAGYWTLYEPQAQVHERDTSSTREEFARRRRITAQGLLAMWKLRHCLRGRRAWQFVSHKFLRWLILAPLVMTLISTAYLSFWGFFKILLGLQILFYGVALGGFFVRPPSGRAGRVLSAPFYILLGSVGAVVGIAELCFGRRFDIWDIPAMSRGCERAPCQEGGK